jgi:hypothetical protein
MVQDEGAHVEGAGERVVRYAVDGDRVESGELLDGGVGHALVDLLAPQLGDASSPRWLAFSDPQERAHLVPLGPALRLAGLAVAEPALDGARVVASLAPDVVYAVGPSASSPAPGAPGARPSATSGVELRRLVCR